MKIIRKGIIGMLIFTMIFIGLVAPVTYADAPSTWAQDTIKEAKEHQLATERILSNYQQPITREEFAEATVQLYNALGGEASGQIKENPFIDTNNPTVLQAYNLGIINGQSANLFAPDASITRQELSVMLVRTMKALDSNFQPIASRPIFFLDQDEIASWAMKEIEYLYDQGIITGVAPLRIDPRGLTTREQAIVLTMRTYELYDMIIRQANALRIGQGADARALDPHSTNDTPSSRVMSQIYDTLVNQNEDMEIEPGLAESWKYIDDLTIEFKLKQGVKFHNGEEFTSKDVKFTFLRAVESPYIGHIIGQIDPNGIKVIDDYTIQISTIEPYPPIISHLAHIAGSMLNEKAVIEAGDDYGMDPVGTGAFKFDSWNIGDSIELVKFDDYHAEVAKVERVVFKNIAHYKNRLDELEKEEIHIAYDISPNDIKRVEDNDDIILRRSPSASSTYIGFNVQQEPYNDVRVRQAINYAVDMDMIVETVMQGAAKVASGPLGASVWASNQSLKPYEYNVEKAKKLLAEAGYSNGFKTSIWINDNQQRVAIASIIAEQLNEIGIDVEINIVEWGQYLDGTANGQHDMFVLGWVTVTGDPDYGLYSLFHSSQFGAMGNRTFYRSEEVDELLDKGRLETDPEARKSYYLEAQEIIREEAPWIFAWITENLVGIQSNVKGFTHHPLGQHKLSGVELK